MNINRQNIKNFKYKKVSFLKLNFPGGQEKKLGNEKEDKEKNNSNNISKVQIHSKNMSSEKLRKRFNKK